MTHIEQLEQQLEQAKLSSQPQATELLKVSKDEVVSINRTTGTTRTDLYGGEDSEPSKIAARESEIPLLDRPLNAALGLTW